MGQELVELLDYREKVWPQLLPDCRVVADPDVEVESSQGTLPVQVQEFQPHLVQVEVVVELLAAGVAVGLKWFSHYA